MAVSLTKEEAHVLSQLAYADFVKQSFAEDLQGKTILQVAQKVLDLVDSPLYKFVGRIVPAFRTVPAFPKICS